MRGSVVQVILEKFKDGLEKSLSTNRHQAIINMAHYYAKLEIPEELKGYIDDIKDYDDTSIFNSVEGLLPELVQHYHQEALNKERLRILKHLKIDANSELFKEIDGHLVNLFKGDISQEDYEREIVAFKVIIARERFKYHGVEVDQAVIEAGLLKGDLFNHLKGQVELNESKLHKICSSFITVAHLSSPQAIRDKIVDDALKIASEDFHNIQKKAGYVNEGSYFTGNELLYRGIRLDVTEDAVNTLLSHGTRLKSRDGSVDTVFDVAQSHFSFDPTWAANFALPNGVLIEAVPHELNKGERGVHFIEYEVLLKNVRGEEIRAIYIFEDNKIKEVIKNPNFSHYFDVDYIPPPLEMIDGFFAKGEHIKGIARYNSVNGDKKFVPTIQARSGFNSYSEQFEACLLSQYNCYSIADLYHKLSKAIAVNNQLLIDELLARTNILNARDKSGNNLLMIAVLDDNPQVVEFALKHNLITEDENYAGFNSQALAAQRGSIKCFDLLFKDKPVNDPQKILTLATINTRRELAIELLKNNIGIDITEGQTGSVLHLLIEIGDSEIADLFLSRVTEKNREILFNTRDDIGYLPLVLAVRENNHELIRNKLLEDPILTPQMLKLGLMKAFEQGSDQLVKTMLALDAKILGMTLSDRTGTDRYKNPYVSYPAQWSLFEVAAYGKSSEALKLLLETVSALKIKLDVPLLHKMIECSVYSGNIESAKLIFDFSGQDAHKLVEAGPYHGKALLTHAIEQGNVDMVKVILDAASQDSQKLFKKDSAGLTPFDYAAQKKEVDVSRYSGPGWENWLENDKKESARINEGRAEILKILASHETTIQEQKESIEEAFVIESPAEAQEQKENVVEVGLFGWLNNLFSLPRAAGATIRESTTALTPMFIDSSCGRAPYNMNNQIGAGTQSANAQSNINYDLAGAASTALYLLSAKYRNHAVDLTPKIMMFNKEVILYPHFDTDSLSLKIDEISKMKQVDRQAELLIKYDGGNTILHLADGEEVEKVLSIKGIDKFELLKQTNENGDAPLHIAVQSDVSTTKTMLKNLAFEERERVLTIRNNQNFTPLELAVQNNDVNMVKGIFSCVTDKHKAYVLAAVDKRMDQYLVDNGYKEMAELLKDYRAKHAEPSYLKQVTDLLSSNIR